MGCGPSEVAVNHNHAQVNNHSQNNNHAQIPVSKKKAITKEESANRSNTLRRGSPLPPRISVTVPPDLALLDVVPTTPIENPTLSGYIYVPPPIPVLVYQGEDTFTRHYLTVRGDRLMFEGTRGELDETQYVFDMYQYASKCADWGTTVSLVHRQSMRCIASESEEGVAKLVDFPDWMSQDDEEIEVNPRFFLRTQESPESDYTLFRCHSGPVKYLARDADTSKAYLSPWMRYPAFLQLKVLTVPQETPDEDSLRTSDFV
ncbi:uncharacterized protein LOC110986005 [Acanthaster planci]|uniref:Uncharacterized protein LOC110986005 n=1 Tax=Acanthaster planci TaxID=133434 RepID=A0A8B7ZC74_ACAPL|nr:uncharacterized protein LOC110986005 [Acanthaster planci]